jgi:hypothetical protein
VLAKEHILCARFGDKNTQDESIVTFTYCPQLLFVDVRHFVEQRYRQISPFDRIENVVVHVGTPMIDVGLHDGPVFGQRLPSDSEHRVAIDDLHVIRLTLTDSLRMFACE